MTAPDRMEMADCRQVSEKQMLTLGKFSGDSDSLCVRWNPSELKFNNIGRSSEQSGPHMESRFASGLAQRERSSLVNMRERKLLAARYRRCPSARSIWRERRRCLHNARNQWAHSPTASPRPSRARVLSLGHSSLSGSNNLKVGLREYLTRTG